MKKQLTDEQIKKALICCYENEGLTCVEMQCPLSDVGGCNDVLMAEYVIDYINRLETQNKILKKYDLERDIRLHALLFANAEAAAYAKCVDEIAKLKVTLAKEGSNENIDISSEDQT